MNSQAGRLRYVKMRTAVFVRAPIANRGRTRHNSVFWSPFTLAIKISAQAISNSVIQATQTFQRVFCRLRAAREN